MSARDSEPHGESDRERERERERQRERERERRLVRGVRESISLSTLGGTLRVCL